MLVIVVSVNVLVLLGIFVFAFLVGYLLRTAQLRKQHSKVIELETEMLRNHADILELQKEKALLEQKLKEIQIPVIPIKSSKEDDASSQAEGSRKKR